MDTGSREVPACLILAFKVIPPRHLGAQFTGGHSASCFFCINDLGLGGYEDG